MSKHNPLSAERRQRRIAEKRTMLELFGAVSNYVKNQAELLASDLDDLENLPPPDLGMPVWPVAPIPEPNVFSLKENGETNLNLAAADILTTLTEVSAAPFQERVGLLERRLQSLRRTDCAFQIGRVLDAIAETFLESGENRAADYCKRYAATVRRAHAERSPDERRL